VAVPTAQPDGRPLGGSELRSYFLPFVDQSTPNYICLCGNVRSLQRHFPIDDVIIIIIIITFICSTKYKNNDKNTRNASEELNRNDKAESTYSHPSVPIA